MDKANEAYWRGYHNGYACAMGDNAHLTIVRCKNCRWHYQLWIDAGIMIEHCHRVRGVVVQADGFCAWGERREDAETD